MRQLLAWDNDELVGRFFERGNAVTFEYGRDAKCPISLSLSLNGGWEDQAPAAFLDGLLPEGADKRLQMMRAIDARSTDAFDLLDNVDSTGDLVFTSKESVDVREPNASPAIDLDIEAQMQRVYGSNSAW